MDSNIPVQNPPSQQSSAPDALPPLPNVSMKPPWQRPWFRTRKVLFIIPGIIIVCFIIGMFLTVYGNVRYPFLSSRQREGVVLFMYHIPFLPKTNEQILVAAVSAHMPITTYTPDFSLSAQFRGAHVVLGALDAHISGPTDITPHKNPSFDLAVDTALTLAGTKYQITGKVRKIENVYYFKIDSFSNSILQVFNTYNALLTGQTIQTGTLDSDRQSRLKNALANWIAYDNSGLSTNANKAIPQDSGKSVQDLFAKINFLPEVKREADEKIGNIDCYQLSISPSKKLLQSIMDQSAQMNKENKTASTQLAMENTPNITKLSITAWFGKSDGLLRKITYVSQTKFSLLQDTATPTLLDYTSSASPSGVDASPYINILKQSPLASSTVDTAIAFELQHIGAPVHVQRPSPTTSITDYFSKIGNALKTKQQLAAEQQKNKYDEDFTTLQTMLNGYYVDKGSYPTSLTELSNKYPAFEKKLHNPETYYLYKIGNTQKKYAMYVLFADDAYSAEGATPYYGLTSASQDPHQLTTFDFDVLNSSNNDLSQNLYGILLSPLLRPTPAKISK